MKKVMIVDDEVLVRVGIKSILEWEKYGYQVVAEASNGREALELIKEHKPNIVMTDLMMSPVDGFELIKMCKHLYPNIQFLVLSSYNDMDNVKKAMKLGAKDYVFKLKVTPQGLLNILAEISEDMEEAKEETNTVWKNIPEIRQNLMMSIVEKSYTNIDNMEEKMQQLGLNIKFREPFVIFMISIDDFELSITGQSAIKDTNLLKFSMMNIIMELMKKTLECDNYMLVNDVLLTIRGDGEYKELVTKIKETFEQISMYIRRYMGLNISGSVSRVYSNMEDVPRAINEIRFAINHRIVIGGNKFFEIKEPEVSRKRLMIPYEGLAYDLEKVISKDGEKLYQYINKFFEQIATLGNIPEMEARKYYLELYHGLSKNAARYKIDLGTILDEYENSLYSVVMKGDTAARIKTSFESVAIKFIVLMNEGQERMPREDIKRIKLYMRNNLDKELTVSSMAEMLGLNGSYFSHVFKKEIGYNFVDYVNNARINRAKELLITTDYRVYEIAKMVGIDNPNYFSILFKKITGQSPNDIRSKTRGEEV